MRVDIDRPNAKGNAMVALVELQTMLRHASEKLMAVSAYMEQADLEGGASYALDELKISLDACVQRECQQLTKAVAQATFREEN